ncbi:MAG: Ribonuclease H [Candidatus Curtissbacteria bacterium GW2011_GWA1_40_24]|uniref:Ribonuclease H n=3 Tax=Patescibacteria group TaxID=1783273 RepID=A0A0G0J2E7_9BACT|nr:MAG: Ribonuclease H [Candidatus Wolfebacteria bacterium GW2011_GWC1_37_10]KKR55709.1 MAG: Ribonuclease H [Candidatus Curtissbacteria bacterium GW2011_GWA1_40_24]KKR89049.1 MAG: Ribonuclease H [Candidatus Wolfebacteria bacterium GW2011_GWB1_41_12]
MAAQKEKIIIYCDGGSRGNPGPAAIGIYIPQLRKGYSKFLGRTTNNEAEYQAAIFALKKIKHLIGGEKAEKSEVEIRSDSELLIKQLNGEYKIKEKTLVPFFIEIWNLKQDFGGMKFVALPREENMEADRLVNRELDGKIGLFD